MLSSFQLLFHQHFHLSSSYLVLTVLFSSEISDVMDYFEDTYIGQLRHHRRAKPLFIQTIYSRRKYTKTVRPGSKKLFPIFEALTTTQSLEGKLFYYKNCGFFSGIKPFIFHRLRLFIIKY